MVKTTTSQDLRLERIIVVNGHVILSDQGSW